MLQEQTEGHMKEAPAVANAKRAYVSPRLSHFGRVRDLTRNSGGTTTENTGPCLGQMNAPTMICQSERRVKQNIVRVGTHPLGFGLYLFDYLPEFRTRWGHGRQFGVMIDEVEKVVPEAVCIDPSGYKLVNYEMLGITRTAH